MNKQYTISVGLLFDEDAVRDFLLSVTDAVNGNFQPVKGHKVKVKRHKKHFNIKVKVKFVDGSVMKWNRKFELDVNAEFVSGSGMDALLSGMQGQLPPQQAEKEEQKNKIGFNLD